MVEFFQQILNALMLGSIYCLVASGLTLVYGIMHVPNFAQGNLYMASAYVIFFFASMRGYDYWFAFLSTLVIMAVVGIVIERFIFRPVRNAPHVNSFAVALGTLMAIEGLIVIIFGADYKEVSAPWGSTLSYHGVTMAGQRIIVILGTLVVIILLALFLKKTRTGMRLDAMSQNRELALMVGVNVDRISLLAFVISTGLAGIGGALIAPVSYVFPAMGMNPLLIAFAAVIFGGMGNLTGAILGSFIMAFTQVFSTQYLSAVFSEVGIFGIMVAILFFRPKGIFAGR